MSEEQTWYLESPDENTESAVYFLDFLDQQVHTDQLEPTHLMTEIIEEFFRN